MVKLSPKFFLENNVISHTQYGNLLNSLETVTTNLSLMLATDYGEEYLEILRIIDFYRKNPLPLTTSEFIPNVISAYKVEDLSPSVVDISPSIENVSPSVTDISPSRVEDISSSVIENMSPIITSIPEKVESTIEEPVEKVLDIETSDTSSVPLEETTSQDMEKSVKEDKPQVNETSIPLVLDDTSTIDVVNSPEIRSMASIPDEAKTRDAWMKPVTPYAKENKLDEAAKKDL